MRKKEITTLKHFEILSTTKFGVVKVVKTVVSRVAINSELFNMNQTRHFAINVENGNAIGTNEISKSC